MMMMQFFIQMAYITQGGFSIGHCKIKDKIN